MTCVQWPDGSLALLGVKTYTWDVGENGPAWPPNAQILPRWATALMWCIELAGKDEEFGRLTHAPGTATPLTAFPSGV
ncbi:MAG: hypothetical protein ACR2JN_05035 [Lapillicoccus sp.]